MKVLSENRKTKSSRNMTSMGITDKEQKKKT